MGAEDWTGVLTSKNPDVRLEKLRESGALEADFPEVAAMVGFGGHGQGHKDLWDHTKKVVKQAKNVPEVRWAALWHDVGKVVSFNDEGKITFHQHEYASARLFGEAMARTRMLQGEFKNTVYALIRGLAFVEGYSHEWTDSAVRRTYKELGPHFTNTLLLARADVTSKHAHKRERVQRLVHELEQRALKIAEADAVVPPLPTGIGKDIMAKFGVPPSKQLGDIKQALEARIKAGALEGHKDSAYYIDYLNKHRVIFGLPV